MARASPCSLSLADWAVLGIVAEGPTHGFAVARLFTAGGEVGRVWTVPRPVVYQVIKKLIGLGLVSEGRTERSPRGPDRTILSATPDGRQAVQRWLGQPVDHVRDIHSALLLKLLLLHRAARDFRPLLAAQRRRLLPVVQGLERTRVKAGGFDRILAEWRLTSSKATLDFLDVLASAEAPQVG